MNIDFIGIGAQKSGTTWLDHQLRQIKEFSLPPVKEFHYFTRSPDYLSPNYLSETLLMNRIGQKNYISKTLRAIKANATQQNWANVKFYLKWYFSNYSDEWYLSLFKDFDGYTGEISPSYAILEERDIKRMFKLAPKTKLIFIIRNPVYRAWSQFRYAFRKKRISYDNFTDDEIMDFLDGERQTLRSDYNRTIDNFLEVFPKNQLLVCFYDAIINDPGNLLSDIIKFICEDTPISISHINLEKVVNKAPVVECPISIEKHLKDKYYTQVKQLAENYGGYFNNWLEETYGESSKNENKVLSPTILLKKQSD